MNKNGLVRKWNVDLFSWSTLNFERMCIGSQCDKVGNRNKCRSKEEEQPNSYYFLTV